MELVFAPGDPSGPPGPLARFLPALERGAVDDALERFGTPGDLVLDPFGVSPRMVLEAAQAGRAVLVASNNPITRFVLRHLLQPFSLEALQGALARLSAAPKDGGRLEPFLLDLYRTQCSRCQAMVSADYFVWDRELELPVLRSYTCAQCNHTVEEPTTASDHQLALEHERRGLQQALALEQVAPAGDPDREHAQAALAVYPGRALYAVVTLLNKLTQLAGDPQQDATIALTLSALDEVNALWGHPEGRTRPLQLMASARYRESNLWRALERAVADWAVVSSEIPLQTWPDSGLPDRGTVALYPGPVRGLVDSLPRGRVSRLLTVFPRPNQAFWTLSALWAAWLWGREAASPIKSALRRRRYDWGWHSGALQKALHSLIPSLATEAEALTFMPDAEPGFVAAALTGMDSAGFRLSGRALRVAEGQALFAWHLDRPAHPATPVEDVQLAASMRQALQDRGEPSIYPLVHAAAFCELAALRALAGTQQRLDEQPISHLTEQLERALGDRRAFLHYTRGIEPESGQYWLADEIGSAEPLADRVERLVLEILQNADGVSGLAVEREVCGQLPGLQTPERRTLVACLQSYAWRDPASGMWRLRHEDQPQARQSDCDDILQLLARLGERLGYSVQEGNPVVWRNPQGDASYRFTVDSTARIGFAIRSRAQIAPAFDPDAADQRGEAEAIKPSPERSADWIVIPGGRASLIAEKSRHDPRVREWMQRSGQMIKFRHIRRLAAETTLDQRNLLERLLIDPPGHHDPQMPLL